MDKIKINIGGTIVEMEKSEVSSAIETGEIKVNSDNLTVLDKSVNHVVYTPEEHETFVKNSQSAGYTDGKIAGEEMSVKAAREKFGLEFEGKKVDNLIEAFKTKTLTEANIKPSERIKELEGEFSTLQKNYNDLEGNFDTFKTTISEKETRSKKDNSILALMPDNVIVDTDIALMSLKAKTGLDVTFSEAGVALQTLNGQTVKDKSLEPLPLTKEDIAEKLGALGLLKIKEGGPGGDDELGAGTAGGYTAFIKEMGDAGKPQGSEAFQEELNKRISANTIDMSK